MIIQLTADDVRLGKYEADGAIKSWPEVDVFERSYEKLNATVHRVGKDAFVVVPPDAGKHIDEITIGNGAVQPVIEETPDVDA